MTTPANPFAVLGIPARPDLDNETVRAAWRAIAAATHPDRPDGGDLARYTQASAAYAELRDPWGRSEAYADVLEQARREGRYNDEDDAGTAPLPVIPVGQEPGRPPVTIRPLRQLSYRIVHGRPLRMLLRAALAAGLSLGVLALIPGQPAAPADVAGIIVWFAVNARSDLAPPLGH